MRIWQQALAMAEQTPAERNRYVDFLRAVSILFVISGHWLIATAWYRNGELELGDMLTIAPWTQGLTWLFQVMPVFFFVGGYSNAVSLQSAARRDTKYAEWLAGRLQRLVGPLLVLLCSWAVFALLLNVSGAPSGTASLASQAALIPIWFLAIYIAIVALAPVTWKLWEKFGFASVVCSVGLACMADAAYFLSDFPWLGWSNYFWIWLAVHQLGYAWRTGRTSAPVRLLLYAALSFVCLYAMVVAGPYPVAMAGSPDAELSNTLPPKVPLLALGFTQFCLLLAVEKPMQRALANLRVWAATVLVNSMIMTVYLWHMTVLIAVVAGLTLAGGWWLGPVPGSAEWWWSRPLWMGLLIAILLPLALLLSGFERAPLATPRQPLSTPRLLCGTIMICLGIAIVALIGFDGKLQLTADAAALVLVLAGAALTGLLKRSDASEAKGRR